jgi:putative DNA primase/helicase
VDYDGGGGYICNHCGNGDGFKLLEKWTGRTFKDLASEIDQLQGNIRHVPEKPKKDPMIRINQIKRRLVHISKSKEVMAYLNNRRLPTAPYLWALRDEPYFVDKEIVGKLDAMVAPFMNPHGKLISFHLTYIQNGQKADVSSPRKLLTPAKPLDGGALQIIGEAEHLGIAEGVETALAVWRDFQIPCWATYSAGMMEKFVPPVGVNAVTIFGDNDALKKDGKTQGGFAGQKAAYTLAHRLAGKGYKVDVKIYPEAGKDFADA